MKDGVQFVINSPIMRRLIDAVPDYSLVGDAACFSPDQFPWAATLEANWKTIREELDQILAHTDALPNFQDIMPRQERISKDDGWKTYFFCAFGYVAQKNCDRCPQTWKLLQEVPGLKSAFFSILAPGKHIPRHTGKHKGIIRYHLALKVPEPRQNCRIQIGDHLRHWDEGKSLIFDDTFPHEVWNETDGYRVVLFADIARPLRFPLSWINALIFQALRFSPLVQSAKQNHAAWEQRFDSAQGQAPASSSS
ncbi:aspartyl/asparaginyl beta-hydroxylase domain-containing protein [Lyngbya confervoides]|uniref:Aspartyl/asparaginyl beta-hydroxylase domain-containing protein n=1 Tax=Lyngbya confervoides BDU141951 TaxID=1574623 RepID=A0ABD4T013_9CYAN|nr:aspartyl/asparaginyl beta-hydroxylase domain-containing protein [Lyngbya confervoides]MCM1981948.1 aspartyl/asparaginyl beta-hydroxylase domain-containing protein [Lyngbya confervoides BDU141951]